MNVTRFLALVVALFLSHGAYSQVPTTRLTWYGHSAFRLQTPQGNVLWIDPWLSNPQNKAARGGDDPLSVVDRADYILLTHGHFDHVGESYAIAKKTKAKLVAPFDLADAMVKLGKFPAEQAGFETTGGPGGQITLANGEVRITFIQAIHSSNLDVPEGNGARVPAVYGGVAVGYVIQIKNGPTIYDSGDTAYFSDMKIVGNEYHPNLAIINIGGHFGMEVPDAIKAARDVGAKLTIPQHYKTFPFLTQNPDGFVDGLKASHLKVEELSPGQTLTFQGVQPQ